MKYGMYHPLIPLLCNKGRFRLAAQAGHTTSGMTMPSGANMINANRARQSCEVVIVNTFLTETFLYATG